MIRAMTTSRRLWSWSLLVACAAPTASCGWLDLDKFRKVSFDLPEMSASFDASDARWKAPPVASLPAVACTEGSSASCCALPAPAPAFDCATYPLTCEGAKCGYTVVYETTQLID